jgi:hypothetical protein
MRRWGVWGDLVVREGGVCGCASVEANTADRSQRQRADTTHPLHSTRPGPTSAGVPLSTHKASPDIAVTVRTGRRPPWATLPRRPRGALSPPPPPSPRRPPRPGESTLSLRHISPSSLPRRPPRTAREPPCPRRAQGPPSTRAAVPPRGPPFPGRREGEAGAATAARRRPERRPGPSTGPAADAEVTARSRYRSAAGR